jgi:hypothetical protein
LSRTASVGRLVGVFHSLDLDMDTPATMARTPGRSDFRGHTSIQPHLSYNNNVITNNNNNNVVKPPLKAKPVLRQIVSCSSSREELTAKAVATGARALTTSRGRFSSFRLPPARVPCFSFP